MQFLHAYDRALLRRPLLVKTLTSAFMFGGGDLMSQKVEGREEIDVGRLARMTAWGALFAPIAHTWYNGLEKVVTGKGVVAVVSKVAADQLIFTPPINSLFFFATTAMETGSPERGIAQIKDKLWPTLQVNWVVWPVLQGINMSIVPLPYRVLFVNVASLFWSAFLSNMANAKAAAPPAALGDVPVAAGTGKADEAKKKAEL